MKSKDILSLNHLNPTHQNSKSIQLGRIDNILEIS